jgi:hypothetical protein
MADEVVNLQSLLKDPNIAESVALSTHTVLYLKDGNDLKQIGLVRNIAVMQDPDVRRAFQIGSKVPFIETGVVNVRIQIGHIVGVYQAGIKTFLDELAGNDGKFNNTKAYDFVIVHYDASPIDESGSSPKPLSAYLIKHCVISSYNISFMAGDTFVIENAVFEAAKVENYNMSSS